MKNTNNDSDGAAIAAPLQRDQSTLAQPLQSAIGVAIWGDFAGNGADATAVAADLMNRTRLIQGGDLRPIEAALLGQAETLGTMFTNLHLMAKRATNPEQFRLLLTLSLKAQAQSRATFETLVETRRPRQLLIARQANIAQQQVVANGGDQSDEQQMRPAARTQAKQGWPNKLLKEEPNGHSMDAGAASKTIGVDSQPSTMEGIDWAQDTARQGHRVKKRVQRCSAASTA